LSLLLVTVLMLSAMTYAAGPGRPEKPDKQKPVPATNVELVEKVTVEKPGQGPPVKPPKPEKGKKGGEEAATGELGAPATGDRFAVVVGISNYPPEEYTPGEGADLSYADDDAIEMAKTLTEVYDFTNVTLLTNLAATRTAILTAIESIPTDADEIVFFFSGHGGSGIANDLDKERVDEAIVAHNGTDIVPIWDGELRGAFSGFDTSRIVFVFDTCLAGGMKKDLEAPGRVIAMATSERGLAYESSAWQNGEFSYYLVDLGTLQGKANVHDYDGDEQFYEPDQVTVEEAFDYAKANCSYDKPTLGDSFENDLLL